MSEKINSSLIHEADRITFSNLLVPPKEKVFFEATGYIIVRNDYRLDISLCFSQYLINKINCLLQCHYTFVIIYLINFSVPRQLSTLIQKKYSNALYMIRLLIPGIIYILNIGLHLLPNGQKVQCLLY